MKVHYKKLQNKKALCKLKERRKAQVLGIHFRVVCKLELGLELCMEQELVLLVGIEVLEHCREVLGLCKQELELCKLVQGLVQSTQGLQIDTEVLVVDIEVQVVDIEVLVADIEVLVIDIVELEHCIVEQVVYKPVQGQVLDTKQAYKLEADKRELVAHKLVELVCR